MGNLQRRVANLASLLAEDGAQQALFCGQLGLALRGDLAHQDIAREDLGTDANDAVGIQVRDHILGDVRNLAGDFLGAELGIARIDFVFGNMDRREEVFGNHALGHDDSVLVVEAFPGHVSNHEVLAQRELCVVAARTVRQDIARMDLVALAYDGLMVDAAGLVGALELRNQILVEFALVVADDDGGAVHVIDDTGILSNQNLAGVDGDAVLDARADQRSMGTQQRHSLTLHVRTHERAVRVVVLEEGNEGRCDRGHLTRGNVHVVHGLGSDLVGLAENASGVARAAQNLLSGHEHAVDRATELAGLLVEQLVRLGNCVVFLFIRSQVVYFVGNLAVHDTTIRGLDEAVAIHASIGCQRADKTDVRAFRSLDRAHAAVVGVMNVSNLEACTLAGQTARAKCGQAALVRDACSGVCLVHELGELRRSEELLDGSDNRTNIDQRLRSDLVGLLHAHALAHDALHAGKTDAELVLDELAHRADATVAEVVDIVNSKALFALVQSNDVAHGCDDVVLSQRGGVEIGIEAELFIRLVAADLREVITLGVEEQAVEQRTRGVDRRRLTGAEALVQLNEGFVFRGCGVAVEGAQNHLGAAEDLDDFLAGFRNAKSAQKQRGRLLTLAIDAHRKNVALVSLEFEPSTAGRNDLCAENSFVRSLIALGAEVHAGRANQLRNDNALGAVDDEGAARGHEREIAHEDFLLLDFAGFAIDEANLSEQRSLERHVLLFAFVDRVFGIAEFVSAKLNAHIFRCVFDGAHVVESLGDSFFHEPLEAVRLDGNQIRDIHDVGNLRKAATFPVKAGGSAIFCFGHRSSFR